MIWEGAYGLRGQCKPDVTGFIGFLRKPVSSSLCVFLLLSIIYLFITNAVLLRESLDPSGAWPWQESRDVTLPTKVHLVKAMVFPVVMYGCEGWTIKKAEGQIIDAFQLWCWGRLLRVPWNARRSNQPILKEISPRVHWKDWCWSWNSNTVATWCEELTHLKRPWCWERLKAGGEGDDRGWDGWMASLTQWTWVWVDSRSWWWTGRSDLLQSMRSQRVRHDWVTELNWTEYQSRGAWKRQSTGKVTPRSRKAHRECR